MVLDCILFYLAGLIQDILLTSYQRFVNLGYRWRAACMSACIAVISILVISRITVKIEAEHVSFPLITYALGKVTGTYTSLRFIKFEEKKS